MALARIVGPTGEVVGADYAEEVIAAANAKARQEGLAERVRHECLDASQPLPFPDNHFYASCSERAFMHLRDPATVLREMVRVTRPGGWIVVADADHQTGAVHTRQADIGWRLLRFRADHFRNGYAGRHIVPIGSLLVLLRPGKERVTAKAGPYIHELLRTSFGILALTDGKAYLIKRKTDAPK